MDWVCSKIQRTAQLATISLEFDLHKRTHKGLLRKPLKPDAGPTIELVQSTDTDPTKTPPNTVIPLNTSTNHIFRVDDSTAAPVVVKEMREMLNTHLTIISFC